MRAITVHGQKGEKMEGLISTDALLKRTDWYSPDVRDAVRNALRYVPTVDAVEVVRCKDCKHKPTGSGVNHHIEFPEQDYRCPCRCEDYWYSWMPDDDWFCANGERREDETN